ncbi:hypothetical protein XELAEV_18033755mg [Xenopus laevis]|uniref:Secreted protein n=1 Tax=Xenopus laevis TaxID=8355 RepID=A0A974CJW8_XENLA|nr:hypothetical protein XELAEV_18033755mg [Xenopus laevis]
MGAFVFVAATFSVPCGAVVYYAAQCAMNSDASFVCAPGAAGSCFVSGKGRWRMPFVFGLFSSCSDFSPNPHFHQLNALLMGHYIKISKILFVGSSHLQLQNLTHRQRSVQSYS